MFTGNAPCFSFFVDIFSFLFFNTCVLFYKETMRDMKTIGLLGGMSWESTVGYYRAINEGIKDALGGLHQ